MNDVDIDRVSRSWGGHLASNPALRKQVNGLAGDTTKLASLINSTVAPKSDVAPTDVPAIQKQVLTAFGGQIPDDDAAPVTWTRLKVPD